MSQDFRKMVGSFVPHQGLIGEISPWFGAQATHLRLTARSHRGENTPLGCVVNSRHSMPEEDKRLSIDWTALQVQPRLGMTGKRIASERQCGSRLLQSRFQLSETNSSSEMRSIDVRRTFLRIIRSRGVGIFDLPGLPAKHSVISSIERRKNSVCPYCPDLAEQS